MTTGDNSKALLTSFIERVENLNSEIKALSEDRSDIFKEAAGQGYDAKALRRVVAIRKLGTAKHEEFEGVVETYLHALGG